MPNVIQNADAKRWAYIGMVFQIPMMAIYMFSLLWFPPIIHGNNPLYFLDLLGAVLFRYTRHPMYFGLLLMDAGIWTNQTDRSAVFFVLQFVFLMALVLAAYCQERETVARFGAEAVAYYKRTSRIPFLGGCNV